MSTKTKNSSPTKIKNKFSMNIGKITENVPIFGTTGPNARSAKKVTNLKALENTGVNFDTYTIREGEILRFPAFEDMEVQEVQVTRGSTSTYHIVKCESEYKGFKKATWFGLPALYKRDVKQNPTQPTWYDFGNNLKRLKALAEMGEIEGLSTIEIQVPVFKDGKPVYVDLFNDDGTPVLENGIQKQEQAVKPQSVVLFTEYVGSDDTVEE